jgi:hypothetical protein
MQVLLPCVEEREEKNDGELFWVVGSQGIA